MRFVRFRAHSGWTALANVYVDGELKESGRSRFETHLEGCSRCRVALGELRIAKAAVSRMSQVPAPRSFRLTPAMVSDVAKPPLEKSRGTSLVLRGAQFTAAIAASVFVVSLAAGVLFSSERGGNSALTASTAQESSPQKSAAPAQDSSANRSAVGGSGQDLPKSTGTVVSSPPATPSAPVTGASAGGRTGDLGSPGATPRVPATGIQPGGFSPAPGSVVGTAVDTAPPGTGQDTVSKGDASALAAGADLPPLNGSNSLPDAAVSTNAGRDGDSGPSRIRLLQFALGALTFAALVTAFAASKRRGRTFPR